MRGCRLAPDLSCSLLEAPPLSCSLLTADLWSSSLALEHDGDRIDPATGTAILRYNPGRANPARESATILTNTKAFLSRGVGLNHWGSHPEIIGFEAHDVGLSISILGNGYIHNAYVRCRTGAALLPSDNNMGGTGFEWYDTNQAHIVSNTTFHSCGMRTTNGAGSLPNDGCGDGSTGCNRLSSVWSLLTHSDEHVPEFMQATKTIIYINCGLRFRNDNFVTDQGGTLSNGMASTVSERIQSWYDADGTTSGLGVPTIIGSGASEAGDWWRLDGACQDAQHAPLQLCKSRGTRQIGSINLGWGKEAQIGQSVCGNGGTGLPCTPIGFIKHWGPRFGKGLGSALPVTLNAEVAGPLGGFGWHLRFTSGAPKRLVIKRIQVPHDTKLLLSIAYPLNTTAASVVAYAPSWCTPWASSSRHCSTTFTRVSSVPAVRASLGNTFHLQRGVLTLRIVTPPKSWTARPTWTVPVDPIPPFVRDGIRIPRYGWWSELVISVQCPVHVSDATLCAGTAVNEEPSACAQGYEQTAYDQCCPNGNTQGDGCVDPEGQRSDPVA